MADNIELRFRKAADRLIPPGASVVAAVSGGADSVALLHLLARMSRGRDLQITVAHLDHALRRGSMADRRFVEKLAAGLDLPCISDRRSVEDLRRRRESPEEAARRVRRAFLVEALERSGASLVVTGHHLDDQAETVIMRLLRGAGPSGLAGISEKGPGPFVRPLLRIKRESLKRFLERYGYDYRDDPTNRAMRYDRNRVRHLVLPMLAEQINPRSAEHLVRAAELLKEDSAYLDRLALGRLARIADGDGDGDLALDATALAKAPPVMARRVARQALAKAGIDQRLISSRHIAALLELAAGGSGKRVDLPGGASAERRGRKLIVRGS